DRAGAEPGCVVLVDDWGARPDGEVRFERDGSSVMGELDAIRGRGVVPAAVGVVGGRMEVVQVVLAVSVHGALGVGEPPLRRRHVEDGPKGVGLLAVCRSERERCGAGGGERPDACGADERSTGQRCHVKFLILVVSSMGAVAVWRRGGQSWCVSEEALGAMESRRMGGQAMRRKLLG